MIEVQLAMHSTCPPAKMRPEIPITVTTATRKNRHSCLGLIPENALKALLLSSMRYGVGGARGGVRGRRIKLTITRGMYRRRFVVHDVMVLAVVRNKIGTFNLR